jgi:hypothetical protein
LKQSRKIKLNTAYIEQFDLSRTYAITLQPNRPSNPSQRCNSLDWIVRKYFNAVNRKIHGRRHYKKPGYLVRYQLNPEGFDRGSPHWHGVIELPFCLTEGVGLELTIEAMSEIWEYTAPGGSILIKQIDDVAGWAKYSSKEHGYGSDYTITSFL